MTFHLAKFALTHLDLTSLNDNDTSDAIAALAQRSSNQAGSCAAVCVWPERVADARRYALANVNIAAVANFPSGSQSLDSIYKEVATALNAGATEIDLVLPYKMLISGV